MMLAFILLSLLSSLRVFCSCPHGFYLHEGNCTNCPDKCSACKSNDYCTECKNGYYGALCSSRCNSHCRNDSCSKSSGFCLSCEDGYFVNTAVHCVSCPSGCSLCSDDNDCSACNVGFKGNRCEQLCVNCKTGTGCDKKTGKCLICENGLSGLHCEQKCSPECRSCERLDKNACISCAPNTHGAKCEFVCPKNCADSVCFNESCKLRCLEGYWGMQCENKCSTHCLGQICDRYSGLCIHNCSANFTDNKCNCPNKCICDNDGRCVYCIKDSDVDCGPRCSEGCKGQYCYRDTRNCFDGCKDNYRGVRCDIYKHEFNGGYRKEIWLIGLLAVPFAVIAFIMFCRLRSRRQTENQESSMMRSYEYIEVANLQQRAYTELNDELREHPSSSTYTPLGLTDKNEPVIDKSADGHDSAYLTPDASTYIQ